MRMQAVKVCAFAAAALFVGTLAAPQAAAAEKIGYVNLSLVFDSYEKTKTFDKDLELQAEQKRKEREVIVNEVKKLRDELELLSEEKKAKKQGEVDEKVKQLQAFDKDARDNLRRQRDGMLREILNEIDTVVKEFGDQEGYQYILNDRVLLYKSETNDLSQKIIQRLNAGKKS